MKCTVKCNVLNSAKKKHKNLEKMMGKEQEAWLYILFRGSLKTNSAVILDS
jgi:hypothetical protein